MTVKQGLLKDRLVLIENRLRQFEEKAVKQSGRLSMHENWRLEYLTFPYLLGAPDERLATRFNDVFRNVTELTNKSQIAVLPIVNEHDFMTKFTHLLEEYGVRTGGNLSETILKDAMAPSLKYFEGGEPIAAKIFDRYSPPRTPFTVKYGQRQHLEEMMRHGRVRFCPASFYNGDDHNAAIKDDEIHKTFYIPTYRERLKGINHLIYRGIRMEFGDDDLELPIQAPDYFLFSLCDGIHYRMPTDFAADAALVITDTNRFVQRLISSFLSRYPRWKPHYGPVTYYDPYRDYTKFRTHQMSKHFGYAYQREVRIVMEACDKQPQELQSEFFDIGPMNEYSKILFSS